MNIIRNMTIRKKLTAIIMLTSISALLLGVTAFVVWEWSDSKGKMVAKLTSHAAVIANNCDVALAFNVNDDATKILNAFEAEPSIIRAVIVDGEGQNFASYSRGDISAIDNPPELLNEGHIFGDDFLTVFKSIYLEGEKIGTIYLQSDLSELHENVAEASTIGLVIATVISIITYFISSRLQRIVSGPILGLAEIAKNVSEEKDYSVRAIKRSNDEVGLLIDAFNEMLEEIKQQDAALIKANEQLEVRVKDRTVKLTEEITEHKRTEHELKDTHERLVEASRQAGMAEVASDVLHNVGNVLNSLNVSTTLISEKISGSKVSNLEKVAEMIESHSDDIETFLTEDPQGKHIPGYLTKVAKLLVDDQADVVEKLHSLMENVQHIREIIKMQQSYAKVSGIEVPAFLTEVVENAIEINAAALNRHNVELRKEFEDIGELYMDKQRVLQILVNLINNAKYAISKNGKKEKFMTVRFYKHGGDRIRIEVTDNGIGISKENLTKIFRHGFTTRREGHGFGLHSAALAAQEMGGSLFVDSAGAGQGATFTLEIPFKPVEVVKNGT